MGKFKKDLKCSRRETIELCPICNSLQSAKEIWPKAEEFDFTVVYDCGTEIKYRTDQSGAAYYKSCNGEF